MKAGCWVGCMRNLLLVAGIVLTIFGVFIANYGANIKLATTSIHIVEPIGYIFAIFGVSMVLGNILTPKDSKKPIKKKTTTDAKCPDCGTVQIKYRKYCKNCGIRFDALK